MKKFISTVILILILLIVFKYRDNITEYILVNHIYKQEIVMQEINDYKLDYNVNYVENKNNFIVNSKKDTLDTIYTVLNNGWNNFKFYCDRDYNNCLTDIDNILQDKDGLSVINNFIHPYNSYSKININYNNLGRIEIAVDYLYSNYEINLLNNKVDEVYNKLVTDKMTNREKIKVIHDYIINNTKYDSERAEAIINNRQIDSKNQSHKAMGPLVEGLGICGGYSDAMALFLNKMDIPNYKISNDTHIWNLVYIDNGWYHLDLTWDDPVVNTGKDLLLYNYFLITTKQLENLKDGKHEYNKNIFQEVYTTN